MSTFILLLIRKNFMIVKEWVFNKFYKNKIITQIHIYYGVFFQEQMQNNTLKIQVVVAFSNMSIEGKHWRAYIDGNMNGKISIV